MAEGGDNKTEPATEKRKADARKDGNIAVSRDVTTAAVLFTGIGLLALFAGPGVHQLTDITRVGLTRSFDHVVHASLTIDQLHSLVIEVGFTSVLLLLPFLGGVALVGAVVTLAQTGLLWKSSLPCDIGKLNPIKGFGRIVSLRSVAEMVKSLLKISIIGGIGAFVLGQDLPRLPELVDYDLWGLLTVMGWLTMKTSSVIVGAISVVAGADFLYQRWEWERSLRMSVQEVKEEHRDAEGDPMLKSRVRSVQREMMRKRMMADVPKADVVITNPTHLAVALKYDTARMSAPIVVAKGAGHLAERIRAVARQHGVVVVENKFVARTLYQLVDIGKEIPADLYRAVAEILAFVFRARGLTSERFTR
ncbi:MAG: flagellar biosynthesis protein FlhB [Nitrospirota bacterium]